jgi:hypothetical protein
MVTVVARLLLLLMLRKSCGVANMVYSSAEYVFTLILLYFTSKPFAVVHEAAILIPTRKYQIRQYTDC